jgi:hypothetical protein
VVKHLLCKCEDLSSNSSPIKKKKKKPNKNYVTCVLHPPDLVWKSCKRKACKMQLSIEKSKLPLKCVLLLCNKTSFRHLNLSCLWIFSRMVRRTW